MRPLADRVKLRTRASGIPSTVVNHLTSRVAVSDVRLKTSLSHGRAGDSPDASQRTDCQLSTVNANRPPASGVSHKVPSLSSNRAEYTLSELSDGRMG